MLGCDINVMHATNKFQRAKLRSKVVISTQFPVFLVSQKQYAAQVNAVTVHVF